MKSRVNNSAFLLFIKIYDIIYIQSERKEDIYAD
jgi:hypothetical protein